MNDSWAAVIVSVVTGGFGLLGILATQLLAKFKTRQINPTADDIIAATDSIDTFPRLDYVAGLKIEMRRNRVLLEDGFLDLKDDLRAIRKAVQHLEDGIN